MTCIIIPTYNRPDYLRNCLASLENTYLPPDVMIYIIDDGSGGNDYWLVKYLSSVSGPECSHGKGKEVVYERNKAEALVRSGVCKKIRSEGYRGDEVKKIIEAFTPSCRVKVTYKGENRGVYDSLIMGHEWAFDNGYDYVISLADDIIVNNYFYSYMSYYKSIFPNNIISGFNTLTNSEKGTPRHPVDKDGGWYVTKKTSGSACTGVDRALYDKYIRPAIDERMKRQRWYDTLATANAHKGGNGVICTVPSVAQHIGIDSKLGHHFNPDIAYDFKIRYMKKGVSKKKMVSVNIATYPPREESLRRVIEGILTYEVIDKIRVYLNEYNQIPTFLRHPKIDTHMGKNIKDSGKFY